MNNLLTFQFAIDFCLAFWQNRITERATGQSPNRIHNDRQINREVHTMSKKSYKNANSRLSKAWSKVEAIHDSEGFYIGEKYTPAKKPLTGRQMNRILYQEGLYWKLRWYGRGWTTNQMPYLYPTHRYVIRDDFGFIRVQQVK